MTGVANHWGISLERHCVGDCSLDSSSSLLLRSGARTLHQIVTETSLQCCEEGCEEVKNEKWDENGKKYTL